MLTYLADLESRIFVNKPKKMKIFVILSENMKGEKENAVAHRRSGIVGRI